MVDRGVLAWRATATATILAFVLYVVTVSHVHGGDTPNYVVQIREGEWLAWQHMLPHVVAGRLLGFTDHYIRGLGTYPVLCTLDAAAGALVVGLFFRVVLTLAGSMPTAALAAAGLAVSNTLWATATTYELALFPVVPVLAAALVGLRHRGGATPAGACVAQGLLLAAAFGFHSLAIGALPAWLVVLALERRPYRSRARVMGVFLASFVGGAVLLYEALYATLPDGVGRTLAGDLARFFAPAPGIRDQAQPTWFAVRGFGGALFAPGELPLGPVGGGLWLVLLLIGSVRDRAALRQRFAGWAWWPAAWLVGVVLVAARVEPGNAEYYLQPIAAALCWTGLLITVRPTPNRARTALAAGVLAVAGSNVGSVWIRHTAYPTHHETTGAGHPPDDATRPTPGAGPGTPPGPQYAPGRGWSP